MGLGGRLELWGEGDGLLSVSVAIDLHDLALVNISPRFLSTGQPDR